VVYLPVLLVDDKRLNWHGFGHSLNCKLSSSYPFGMLLLLWFVLEHTLAHWALWKHNLCIHNKVILSHIPLLCAHSILTLGLFLKEARRDSNVPAYYKLSQWTLLVCALSGPPTIWRYSTPRPFSRIIRDPDYFSAFAVLTYLSISLVYFLYLYPT